MKKKVLLKGIGASSGLVEGPVVIIKKIQEFSKMKYGHILVTSMTSPSWILVMKKAIAVVTDNGGMLSHPAIICREFGIPAVVGTHNATQLLKDKMRIIVDGAQGNIYEKK